MGILYPLKSFIYGKIGYLVSTTGL